VLISHSQLFDLVKSLANPEYFVLTIMVKTSPPLSLDYQGRLVSNWFQAAICYFQNDGLLAHALPPLQEATSTSIASLAFPV